jgi:hypothetical protein
MYRHNLARINYTTYDVRRSQDVINPNTSHRDIILLANQDEERRTNVTHPFLYARVLGIYHVNVVYNGPCMLDYAPRRFYFFWVRWFEYIGDTASWHDRRLDSIHFPPTANSDAFGFVDPRDVLRGCHIVQAFKHGKVHLDGVGLSRCASDAQDWRQYLVNRYLFIGSQSRFTAINCNPISRFIDRDMVMRFHWGLAVGHIYAHDKSEMLAQATRPYERSGEVESIIPVTGGGVQSMIHDPSLGRSGVQPPNPNPNPDELECDQGEFGLENREDNEWEDDRDSGDTRGMGNGWGEESDDEVFGEMHQMYGMY